MSYNEFYQLFNSAPDGMLVVDNNFDILRANRAFAELCGMEKDALIGRKCYEIFSGPTCNTSTCPLQAIFTGKKRFEIECDKILLAKDRKITCLITSTPFLDADGKPAGAIMIITDISSRRQAELALEESTARLKESNRALEDFAHIISHDLQEPLMLIQAFSRRLLERDEQGLSSRSSRYVEQIRTAAEHMRELINGLLVYAKVNNKSEPFVPVNLSTVIDEVLDTLALQIEKSGSTIIRDRLPVISGDPLLIRQLFQNLIGNSLKYRKNELDHEIHIKYRGTVRQENGPDQVEISIRDNGIGFEADAGQDVFDMFERLKAGEDIQGTGIGLAICKKIVARHRGQIQAVGQPGLGAEIIFQLPALNR